MNILLWVLQVALAWLCIAGGAYQIFKLDELKKGVASMRGLPRGLWTFFGALGILTGVGLIVPGMINVMPWLTAFAAAAVAAQSALISAIYLKFRDHAPMGFTIAMTLLAAFVAYGRFVLQPL